MTIITDLHRLENENEENFIWRLGQAKDSGLLDMSWEEISNIINREFRSDESEYRTEAAYRKSYSQAKRFYEAGVFNNLDEDKYFKELQIQKQELEKERVKTRDERTELRRIIREEARKESYRDQIIRSISNYQCKPLSYDNSKCFSEIIKSDNDMLISCFDVHAGMESQNFWNEFNEDILRERLNQYIDKILEIKSRHNSENAYIVLSELVSGFIHLSLRIENNQDMIEQFLCVTSYISELLSELSYHFNSVHVYIAPGNHGRLSPKKEENITNENMDNLVLPFLEAKLQNFKNIICHKNNIEQSIAMFNIRNYKVFSSHGDKESMQNAIQNLTLFTGHKPDIYLCGHRHTNAMMTVYDSKVLQAGCLSGADSYCMDNRLRNRPEQIVAIINEKGLDCIYDVKF